MAVRLRRRVSRAALWSRRLGRFVIPALVLAAVLYRVDVIDTASALAVLGFAWAGAALSMGLALIAIVAVWRLGLEGLRSAVAGILLSLPALLVPLYFGVLALTLPRLNDISTSIFDPPAFVDLSVRPAGANPVAAGDDFDWQLQRQAYPDLVSMYSGKSAEDIVEAVATVIEDQGWEMVATKVPAPPPPEQDIHANDRTGVVPHDAPQEDEWRIQAVARTLLMGFRDDIVVRVRSAGAGARVDVRSTSRVGRHDFGANANRIRRFLIALRAELDPVITE